MELYLCVQPYEYISNLMAQCRHPYLSIIHMCIALYIISSENCELRNDARFSILFIAKYSWYRWSLSTVLFILSSHSWAGVLLLMMQTHGTCTNAGTQTQIISRALAAIHSRHCTPQFAAHQYTWLSRPPSPHSSLTATIHKSRTFRYLKQSSTSNINIGKRWMHKCRFDSSWPMERDINVHVEMNDYGLKTATHAAHQSFNEMRECSRKSAVNELNCIAICT